jgi:hypothetical protein
MFTGKSSQVAMSREASIPGENNKASAATREDSCPSSLVAALAFSNELPF